MSETVRVATDADRAAIQRLVNEAFARERELKKGRVDRLDPAGHELTALMSRGVFLLLEDGGELRALVYLEPRGERCYLGLLSVAPSCRGTGLGRRMTDIAEAYAREHGCGWMDLRVVSPRRNELVPLYLKLGYSEQGTQEYPAPVAEKMINPGHFIVMAKQL